MKFNSAPFNAVVFDGTRYDAVAALAGVSATGDVGTLGFSADSSAVLTAVTATGAVGTLTLRLDASVLLTGVQADGAVGNIIAASGDAAITLPGVAGTGGVGDLVASAGAAGGMDGVWAQRVFVEDRTDRRHANVRLRGVAAQGAAGDLDAHGVREAVPSVDLRSALVVAPVVAQLAPIVRLRARTDAMVRMPGVSARVVSLPVHAASQPVVIVDEELEDVAILLAAGWR